nr:MAG TPA: hypothetical protein [Caudoviricetes sp.]
MGVGSTFPAIHPFARSRINQGPLLVCTKQRELNKKGYPDL